MCNSVFAQEIKTENKEQKLDVSFSYGLSYKDYGTSHYYGYIKVPAVGSFYELKLSEKDYIGVGYSRKDHTKHVNNTIAYEGVGAANTEMVFNNYASTLSHNFYDVHYRRLLVEMLKKLNAEFLTLNSNNNE